MKNIYLLVIDPQRDFCEGGSLPVTGGLADMNRLAEFLTKHEKEINEVRVTMDCHQAIHIAHPIFWVNDKGEHPAPYTVITEETMKSEGWKPFHPELMTWAYNYVTSLKTNGRYDLRIWPPHCIFGTEGWTVVPNLMKALLAWENNQVNRIHWIQKGNNFLTEQYSAVKADVPDPQDPTTQINNDLIADLNQADTVLVGGEALSHCVGGTLWDIAENGGDMSKYVLLTDCTSNVTGCEALGQAYIDKLVAKGMRLATSDTWKA